MGHSPKPRGPLGFDILGESLNFQLARLSSIIVSTTTTSILSSRGSRPRRANESRRELSQQASMAPLRDAFVQYISRTSYVSLCADIACACLTVYILSALSTSNNRLYPPGPPGWPIVGNAFQLPINKHWLLFDKWTQDYGTDCLIYSQMLLKGWG